MPLIELQRLPLLASGAAMLLLALILLRIDFDKRVNRAFAAFLGLRGAVGVLLGLTISTGFDRAMVNFGPYISLALVPALLYFASVFPRRRGPLGRPGMGWAALALAGLLACAYLVWHAGYQTVAEGPAATPIMEARGGLHYQAFGPLALLGFGVFPLSAAIGLLFVKDYTRSAEGTQRTSYFLVAAGFLVNGAFDGARQSVGLVRLLQDSSGFSWLPWNWTLALLPALSLIPALLGLAIIAKHRFVNRGDEQRRERLLFALALLAILTGLSPILLSPRSAFLGHPMTIVLLGLWRLTLPIFVSYALLRYALFDIDLKVRAAVAGSVVVIIGAAGYFLVSETLEGKVADRFGNLGGLAAAALFTLIAGPLAGAGKKVSRFIMPGVHDVAQAPANEALDIYRQQYLMLQEDGSLTAKERVSLDGLRDRLRLDKAVARSIEQSTSSG